MWHQQATCLIYGSHGRKLTGTVLDSLLGSESRDYRLRWVGWIAPYYNLLKSPRERRKVSALSLKLPWIGLVLGLSQSCRRARPSWCCRCKGQAWTTCERLGTFSLGSRCTLCCMRIRSSLGRFLPHSGNNQALWCSSLFALWLPFWPTGSGSLYWASTPRSWICHWQKLMAC